MNSGGDIAWTKNLKRAPISLNFLQNPRTGDVGERALQFPGFPLEFRGSPQPVKPSINSGLKNIYPHVPHTFFQQSVTGLVWKIYTKSMWKIVFLDSREKSMTQASSWSNSGWSSELKFSVQVGIEHSNVFPAFGLPGVCLSALARPFCFISSFPSSIEQTCDNQDQKHATKSF